MTLRAFLYALARYLGDVNAISRGPTATAKRIGRKAAWRVAARGLGRFLR